MKIPAAYQRKRARIEIIPLIDIMFFLLATFVVVSLSMIRNEGITVRLPTAQSAAQEERNASITVSISGSSSSIASLRRKVPTVTRTVLVNGSACSSQTCSSSVSCDRTSPGRVMK